MSAAALVRGTNAGQFDKVKLLHPGGAPPPGATSCGYDYSGGPYPFIWGQAADYTSDPIAGFNVTSGGQQATITTFSDAETCSSLGSCSVSFGAATMTVKGGNGTVPGRVPCTTQLTFYDATF